ncbi:MAG: carbohydrate kinase [Marinilabiliales bacterium]|nr:MAG: carbohydrate kinase [Marinilabiliales bacterium]
MSYSRRFFCVGETVFDIIFKNGKPLDATPGGAMLNTAVSLGRLGMDVYLVGDYANDPVGNVIDGFLKNNNVSTTYVTRYNDALSRLALAFLNDRNDAEYSFYKIRKDEKAALNFPEPDENDIILFGSFYGIKDEIRSDLTQFLDECVNKGALIIYDPNFRKNHLKIKDQVMPFIEENIRFSSITKGSDEDFMYLFNTSDPTEVYKTIRESGSEILIMTANSKGVDVLTPDFRKHYSSHEIDPVSTVGAGDSFNAGLLYALHHKCFSPDDLISLTEKDWDELIEMAILFAESVCMSFDNYISIDFAGKLRK